MLEFLVSAGRKHGFESLEERAALLALDFMAVIEVLPQPFTLSFEHVDGHAGHTPDFLAVMGDSGHWLLDIRPAGLTGEVDAVKFAASREAAAACGWRYSVITGWRPHALSGLDALSAQRRPLTDQLGCQPALLAAAADGPVAFGELVQMTRLPAVGRAHAVHLLWHRRPRPGSPAERFLPGLADGLEGAPATAAQRLLDLAPGAGFRIDGVDWFADEVEPQHGLGMRGLTPAPRGVFPVWLLTTSTRYCPSCLSGDGSAIQQRHGGPWKPAWRMAADFACLEHRCFLAPPAPPASCRHR
ncbi:TniQ family protein [Streptomyces griseomycini]|uniref:TniQ domain-containing protein n=1 Tax=Streptomyces griseomycini TaxID=66895 RepID=A0A7W7VAC8_9ACTN|nr:TniQ family protein [Streptomyces griseomycini]MBB4902712.1 hypothetical protein [Streptomyces griseomycini]GGR60153.1 hypothetical protein GCM10015536_75440 [Streptomyces griseomycini]